MNAKLRHHLVRGLLMLGSSLLTVVSASTHALDYRWDLSSEIEHQSNATLSEDAHSGVLTVTGSRFIFSQDVQSLELSGNYNTEFSAYLNDTNEDRFDANGNSYALWQVTDRLLAWQFFHHVSSTVSNRRASSSDATIVDTADNRRTRNEVATGPIINLPVTEVDSVILTGRFQQVKFNDAENDSVNTVDPDADSRSGSASWQHQLSATSALRLSYDYREVERDDGVTEENTTIFETAYLEYSQALNRNNYLIRLGNNRGKSRGRNDSDGFYYLGEYQRDFGNQQLALTVSQQQTSTSFGTALSSLQGFDSSSSRSVTLSQGNYEIDNTAETIALQIDYSSTMYCTRCEYGITYSHVDNEYIELRDEDDSIDALTLNYQHRLRQNFSGYFSIRHLRRNFDTANNDNHNTDIGITFDYEQNNRLSLQFGTRYMTNSSDREVDSEFENFTLFLGLEFNLMDNTRG